MGVLQIVLRTVYLRPYVFEWNNEYYLVPETIEPETIRLYKANDFPTHWSLVGPLLDVRSADPSIFRWEDKWWMFTCSTPFQHDALSLYFANQLLGPWTEHPRSPSIEGDKRNARPAGRVLTYDIGGPLCPGLRYAYAIRSSIEITELTESSYVENEHADSPILNPA